LVLNSAVGLALGHEEFSLLLLLVLCALDGDGVLGLEVGIVKRFELLLLADRGVFDVLGQRLLLFLPLAGSLLRLRLGLGLSLLRQFCILLGLLALSFDYRHV
jgi:hypothetical protein